MSFRWYHSGPEGGVYIVAELYDAKWFVSFTDATSHPVAGEQKREAIKKVLDELSSLRQYLWNELGKV